MLGPGWGHVGVLSAADFARAGRRYSTAIPYFSRAALVKLTKAVMFHVKHRLPIHRYGVVQPEPIGRF